MARVFRSVFAFFLGVSVCVCFCVFLFLRFSSFSVMFFDAFLCLFWLCGLWCILYGVSVGFVGFVVYTKLGTNYDKNSLCALKLFVALIDFCVFFCCCVLCVVWWVFLCGFWGCAQYIK